MQMLMANAARLTPEYKQRRKQEWGIEGTPFDVGFIMFTKTADEQDLAHQESARQTLCANGMCSQPARSRCSRCQV